MSYNIGIDNLFPTKGILDNIGFLFGAGTSKEAGYPLINDLTKNVLEKLGKDKCEIIKAALKRENLTLDNQSGTPDIEIISDIIAKSILDGDVALDSIRSEIHAHIVQEIESIRSPYLEHHIAFFDGLKKRCGNNPTTIWIFTTNYDMLFELAAFHTGINMNTGFSGTLKRFFDLETFKLVHGLIERNKFCRHKKLTVNLIKLHGSVCWKRDPFKEQYEESLQVINSAPTERLMIMPRRRKIFETMHQPYSQLFTFSASIIGSKCKYLASCGFSYNDEHIMENLILPAVQNNSFRLFALLGEKSDEIENLKNRYPNKVFYCTPDVTAFDAHSTSDANVIGWKFSELARIF